MFFGVFQRKLGKGSLLALTVLLVVVAGTVSAVRPLNIFAASTDTCGYDPNAAPAPGGGTVIFNENTVTRAIDFYGVGLSGHVGVFTNDESGLLIGAGGTPSSSAGSSVGTAGSLPANTTVTSIPVPAGLSVPVSSGDSITVTAGAAHTTFTATANAAAGATSISVQSKAVGATALTGGNISDPSIVWGQAVPPTFGTGSDADSRPIAPTIYLTDITSSASATGGDWENGGQPATTGASGIYGSWSPTLGTKPVNQNNWNLGPNADDPVAAGVTGFNEGYGSEVEWNTPGLKAYDPTTHTLVAVQPGHTYRVQSLTHDTDQNKGNGDVGEVCTTFHIPVANLTITKTADASPVNAGDSIGFTVEVKNTGDADATGASLNDSLPAGSGSGVTWAVDGSTGTPANFVLAGSQGSQTLKLASSTIPHGADYTIHITASTSASECGVYDNTATLTSSSSNPPPASAEEVCNPAHVSITKTADASPVNAGDSIGFTVEVKNTGTGLAKGVNLADSLPGGSGSGVTWAVDGSTGTPLKFTLSGAQGSQMLKLVSSSLAAGADYTIHITATTSASECGVYDNTATLTTSNANNPNPASAEEVCNPAHVSITKTADASPVNAGDSIGFTVEVKNTGTGTANGVNLADSLPGGSGSGVTWAVDNGVGTPAKFTLSGAQGSQTLKLASSSLSAGADYTIHITATTSASECGVYDNTATLTTSNANNPNPASAEEVCNPAHVSITKTADASPVNAGDSIGFTVEVKNTGTGLAKGVNLADSLPGGSGSGVTWAVDGSTGTPLKFTLSGAQGSQMLKLVSSSLAAGADYTIHITATTSASECGVYDNTATLTTSNANNPNPASAEEVCNPAHVSITKTADASPVNAGDSIGFTVEVKNTGTGTATGVSLADSLPAGSGSGVTWAVDNGVGTPAKFKLQGAQGAQTLTLASNTLTAGADYTIHITATTSASECGVYDNTATLTTSNANNPNPASAEEVCNPAHVSITKTADASPVNAGDSIGFTVEVKNTGTGTATGVNLADSLPGGSGSGVTWAVDNGVGTPAKFTLSGAQGSQMLKLASSSLSAGADYTIHITASTSASECGVYDNTATLTTSNANNPNPASAEEVCNPAHVSITKTADASPVNAGDSIGFTVEVKNTGTGTANGVNLADSLPGGSGSGVTWAVDNGVGTPAKFTLSGAQGSQMLKLVSSSLSAGADYTIHITASTSASECGVYDNTATLTTSNANNPNPASAEEVCNPAHVSITKTADASPVNAGDSIGFTVEVKNTGTGTATGVGLADSLPAGSGSGVTWAVDNGVGTPLKFKLQGAQGSQTLSLASNTLPVGADYTIHITATTSATECGVYDNTATLTTANAGNPPPASAEEVCKPAHVSITKTADASPVNAGDPIGFTVEVKNTGTGTATGVGLADSLPGGSGSGVTWAVDNGVGTPLKFKLQGAQGSQTLTLASNTLAAGADYTIHITASTSASECGEYDNTATLTTSNANNPNPASATELCLPAHVTITKTADASPVNAGDPIGFTVEVKNTGTGTATGVSLADSLPGGSGSGVTWAVDNGVGTPLKFKLQGAQGSQTLTLASNTLAAGADYTIHITASTSASECGEYDNTATLTTSNANNPNPASATELCLPAHVTITKTADASPVNAGDPIGFTVEVKNTGTGTATGVSLADSLPAGSGSGVTWAVDNGVGTPLKFKLQGAQGSQTLTLASNTLAAGADYTIHITASTSATECGVYDNTATLTTTNANNPNPASAEEVCNQASIKIDKTADALTVNQGQQIGFTVTVYNSGSGDAKGVKLKDQLPPDAGLSWTIANQGGGWAGTCAIAGSQGSQTLNCGPVTVPANTTELASTFTVHIISPTDLFAGGLCPNTGVVTNTGYVTTTNDGSGNAAAHTCVEGITDLSITKTGTPASQDQNPPYQNITWTMVVTNNGPDVDTNVTVSDPIPAGNTYVSFTIDPTKGSCIFSAGTLNCNLGTMQVGASVPITLVTTPTTTGQQTNTAVVAGDLPETTLTNNTATATVLVAGPHVLPCTAVLVKPKQFYVGRLTTMHITVISDHKRVPGVRVQIKGPGIHVTTKPSNAKGKITKTIKPKKSGAVTFRPLATKSCKVPRVGITGIFTPPVTG